jgi:predicted CXXCH cytochrome family protein
MKKAFLYGFIPVLTLLLASPSGAVPGHKDNDIHISSLQCIDCHTKTPSEGDTLETAPLIAPVPNLCISCHQGGMGGGRIR